MMFWSLVLFIFLDSHPSLLYISSIAESGFRAALLLFSRTCSIHPNVSMLKKDQLVGLHRSLVTCRQIWTNVLQR